MKKTRGESIGIFLLIVCVLLLPACSAGQNSKTNSYEAVNVVFSREAGACEDNGFVLDHAAPPYLHA